MRYDESRWMSVNVAWLTKDIWRVRLEKRNAMNDL